MMKGRLAPDRSPSPTKAREKLGWTPRIRFEELVAEMVREDLKSAESDDQTPWLQDHELS